MEFLAALVGPVVEPLLGPVKKHLGYLFSSTKHVRNMTTKMQQLHGASVDVKTHMERNDRSNLEIPARVPAWLEEVEKIKEDAQDISSNVVNGCFNLKMRYRAGRKAFKTIQEIEGHIKEHTETSWTDAPIPLGKVSSKKASTSGPSDDGAQNDFKSRGKVFKEALGYLQQDHTAQVIALCGMGGVGKTTMMEQLKKAVEDKKMFDYVVKVVIGQKMNTFSIQQTVAGYLEIPITETSGTAADHLRVTFEKMSKESKKVLIILDDVWEMAELKDIGLCPLPNGSKLLLTSRDANICRQIAIEANLEFRGVRVDVMEELEANSFFCKFAGISKENLELNDIGVEIVRKCGFLPLAIKLIARALNSQEKSVWKDTLHRLKEKDFDKKVQQIIEISYTFIKEEDEKAIFLLCGLFPDDFDIPIDDLTRYAWGLQLLNKVSTLGDARNRTKTCVLKLKSANLLMDSDHVECVKMHDLVLAFVVGKVSKDDHPWIINHGDLSSWSRSEMTESNEFCKRISLTCMGMSEFPRDFNHPNVSLLKLMNGDKSLKFPDDFYEKMKNLQVMSYEKLQYPLLPRSLQCSTKLRTLCLHECNLMFDCSVIGDHLLNLEVLSFARSRIRYLPSAIGNLDKLKLLDLTDCIDLRIAEDVLKKLIELEELYMSVADEKSVRFTDMIYKELTECSKNLSALEVEFIENNPELKNMSYNKLERFKISMGGILSNRYGGKDTHSSENTLELVVNKDEVLQSGMNVLFQKTEVLLLKKVGGMNNLEEVLPKPVSGHWFYNLKDLNVSECGDLRHLFTARVATGLVKLERLTIWNCPVMETLVYSENGEEGVVSFQELKELRLYDLPMLVGFSNTNDVIDLPQLVMLHLVGLPKITSIYPAAAATSVVMSTSSGSSSCANIKPFFNKQVMIPKLERLKINGMEALRNIWPCGSSSEEEVDDASCLLRDIEVSRCENLVNMFPRRNPMPLLHHLETIEVHECDSIEVLFDDIDVGCLIGEIKQEGGGSKLRSIEVYDSGKFREVWRLKDVTNHDLIIGGFQAVEKIKIHGCKSFKNIFTPTTARFDLGALRDIHTYGGGHDESVEKIDDKGEIIQVGDNIPFHHLLPTFHHLESLCIEDRIDVEVLFDDIQIVSSSSSRATTWDNQRPPPPVILPHLKSLELFDLKKMECVWKCIWNQSLYSQKQPQSSSSSFHNLTTIHLINCGKIKYLLSPLMVKLLLFNLKEIDISDCDGIEEVVSNRDDDDDDIQTMAASRTNPTFFPHLDSLYLYRLPKLKLIDDNFKSSQTDVISWSLCHFSRNIVIEECNALSTVIPFNAVGKLQMLETLIITECRSMREIFEGCGDIQTAVRSANMIPIELPSLQILHINQCDALLTVIPFNAVGKLQMLEKLEITACRSMREIFEIQAPVRSANMIPIELPNLQILHINQCDLLEHVFTSSTLESLKQLKELTITKCKAMQVIVKEDGEHTRSAEVVVFPNLKSLTLTDLPNVKAFFLGMNEFRWPRLDEVKIHGCPQMEVFTSGRSMTPKLSYMHTGLGKHSLECGLNFQLTHASHETLDMINLLQYPWSFSNLIEVDVSSYSKLLESRIIFPYNELHKLQNLEKLNVTLRGYYVQGIVEEVFEVVEGTNDYMNETQSVNVVFPKLKQVTLENFRSVKHIWKSNPRIVLNFPNLTKVLIHDCPLLGHVFTSCMVGSLLQLQELHISDCENMEVVVKQEEDHCDTRANEVVEFPRLKSLTLTKLENLKGFYLGSEAFKWPSLDTLEIKDCPQITVFTHGQSTAPELKMIDTTFGLCDATEDPTSFIKTKQQEGWEF